MQKLDIHETASLVRYAVRQGASSSPDLPAATTFLRGSDMQEIFEQISTVCECY
jgi:hypothetical protein